MTANTPPRNSSRLPRSGITVLELIVALTLGLVLLSAIWTMFRLFLRHQEIETAQVQKVQLVSSLHQLLSHDLRNVIPEGREGPRNSAPRTSAPESGAVPPATAELLLFPTPFNPAPLATASFPDLGIPDEPLPASFDLPTSSLKGDSTRLELAVFATAEDLLGEDSADTRSPRSSLSADSPPPTAPSKVVTYEFIGLTNELASTDLAPNLFDDTDPAEDDPVELATARVGLWRRELAAAPSSSQASSGTNFSSEATPAAALTASRSPERIADSSTPASPSSGQIEEFAPEIIDLEFDYFDGQKWSSNWDSQQQKQLPVLVRVRLAVETRTALRKRKLEERLEAGLTDEVNVTLEADPLPGLTTNGEAPPLDAAWDYQFLLFVTPPANQSSGASRGRTEPLTPDAPPLSRPSPSSGRTP